MTNQRKDDMDNINRGDILADRDTRRQGRKVKVVWVGEDHVTVETIADPINAKVSSIGNQTDVKRDRLKKGYTLSVPNSLTVTEPTVATTIIDTTLYPQADPQELSYLIEQELGFDEDDIELRDFGRPEPETDLITDEVDLEDALNTAGYFWLPPLDKLEEAVDGLLHTTSKKSLVALLHGVIKNGAVAK